MSGSAPFLAISRRILKKMRRTYLRGSREGGLSLRGDYSDVKDLPVRVGADGSARLPRVNFRTKPFGTRRSFRTVDRPLLTVFTIADG